MADEGGVVVDFDKTTDTDRNGRADKSEFGAARTRDDTFDVEPIIDLSHGDP